jgi:hypothetical protein
MIAAVHADSADEVDAITWIEVVDDRDGISFSMSIAIVSNDFDVSTLCLKGKVDAYA